MIFTKVAALRRCGVAPQTGCHYFLLILHFNISELIENKSRYRLFISYFIRTFASSTKTKVSCAHTWKILRAHVRDKNELFLTALDMTKKGVDARQEKNGMPITTSVKNAQILLNMEKFYYFCKNIVNYATEIIWV